MKPKVFSTSAVPFLLLSLSLLSSCEPGILVKYAGGLYYLARSKTETRSLGAFTSIEIVGNHISSQLDLHQGTQKVEVKADCDDMSNITTTVTGTRLFIDASHLSGNGVALSFDITMPTLEELVTTSCYCNLYDFSGTSLSCKVDSGDVNSHTSTLTYDTVTLNAAISGSGNIHYWGDPTITRNITGTGLLIKRD